MEVEFEVANTRFQSCRGSILNVVTCHFKGIFHSAEGAIPKNGTIMNIVKSSMAHVPPVVPGSYIFEKLGRKNISRTTSLNLQNYTILLHDSFFRYISAFLFRKVLLNLFHWICLFLFANFLLRQKHASFILVYTL